jgi:hypothetical protein
MNGIMREVTRARGVGREPLVASERLGQPCTVLFADPPTALAVIPGGASCVARAVPSGSMSCMCWLPRVPTGRFK